MELSAEQQAYADWVQSLLDAIREEIEAQPLEGIIVRDSCNPEIFEDAVKPKAT